MNSLCFWGINSGINHWNFKWEQVLLIKKVGGTRIVDEGEGGGQLKRRVSGDYHDKISPD